ncbi:MFS transporter [Roseomonas sp. NAR14]|uniref:MFS transporter n=1 Tax=Roseomonas acroporae TaxID=2937791 RepID=A0A9X1Y685_9PROT|nr:MFS transporter [Roseomonas acroporae]MCK8784749.1 MFS transporter [Roseomonas acroporae]
MGTATNVVDVEALIDRRIGRYQIGIFVLCFLVSLMDGLDSQITSVTGPLMARDLGLPPAALGPLLSASQIGSLVGALALGFCGDRFGRRPTLLACGLLFSVATLATAMAETLPVLLVLRAITGLGIGGAVPCYLALGAEFAPRRHRAGIVALILGAVPCGGIIAGLIGAGLLGDLGWRNVYLGCGVLSLGVCLLLAWRLPESPGFLIASRAAATRIRAVLAPLAPPGVVAEATLFRSGEPRQQGVPVTRLFADGRAPVTLLLWLAFFVTYLVLIGGLVWTPGLMRQSGMSAEGGALALMFNNVGGILGIVCAGQIIDRFRGAFTPLMVLLFLGGAAATGLVGQAAPNFWGVILACGATGLFMAAGLSGLYAFATLLYPAEMRSTGLGWASGFGRVGAAAGPLLGGTLFAAGQPARVIFLVFGLAAVVNAGAILAIAFCSRRRRPDPADGATAPV